MEYRRRLGIDGRGVARMADVAQRPLSPWWKHGAILVMIIGFSGLTLVTVLTYTNAPPIPARVTDGRE